MKHLKRFNEVNLGQYPIGSVNELNIEDVIKTIRDILLPIADMGYEIKITEYRSEFVIRVVTYVDKPLLITDEVKDEFIRMNDYLEDLGGRVKALYVPESASYHDYDYFHDPTEDYEAGRLDVPFNDFIKVEDCKLRNLLFVVDIS
jgi:hypothetical protein